MVMMLKLWQRSERRYAAELNNEEWIKWEKVILAIHSINRPCS